MAMKPQTRRDEIEPRRRISQFKTGKEPPPGELAAPARVIDAQPVIQSLKRQLRILCGLDLDDDKTAVAINSEQIEN